VQQLRKSYSLSDLTGEKEDENRNTTDARDETDMEGSRSLVCKDARMEISEGKQEFIENFQFFYTYIRIDFNRTYIVSCMSY